MAGDVNALNQQVIDAENALKVYSDPTAATQIRNNVNAAYTPILQNSLQDTANQMQDYMGSYMSDIYNYGTSEADLSPQQKMGVLGRQLGGMAGRLQYSSGLSAYLGGKMNEMAQNALQAWQLGNQAAAATYDRAFQRYQLALQAAEAEKNRRMQQQIASMGYGNGNISGDTNYNPDIETKANDWTTNIRKAADNIAKGLGTMPTTKQNVLLGMVGGPVGALIGSGVNKLNESFANQDWYRKLTQGFGPGNVSY